MINIMHSALANVHPSFQRGWVIMSMCPYGFLPDV
jgi:hypothetical protein